MSLCFSWPYSIDNQAYQGDVVEIPPVQYVPSQEMVAFGNPQQVETMNNVKRFIAGSFEGAVIVEERSVSYFQNFACIAICNICNVYSGVRAVQWLFDNRSRGKTCNIRPFRQG